MAGVVNRPSLFSLRMILFQQGSFAPSPLQRSLRYCEPVRHPLTIFPFPFRVIGLISSLGLSPHGEEDFSSSLLSLCPHAFPASPPASPLPASVIEFRINNGYIGDPDLRTFQGERSDACLLHVSDERRRNVPNVGLPCGAGHFWAATSSLLAHNQPGCSLVVPRFAPKLVSQWFHYLYETQ